MTFRKDSQELFVTQNQMISVYFEGNKVLFLKTIYICFKVKIQEHYHLFSSLNDLQNV